MKPKTILLRRVLPALLITGVMLVLVSWDFKQHDGRYKTDRTDTVPKKEKKIVDLDDALDEVNGLDMNWGNLKRELSQSMKQLDLGKMQLDKLKDLDFSKLSKDLNESMAKVDWSDMKLQLDKLKDLHVDLDGLENLKNMHIDLGDMHEQLQKELKNIHIDMSGLQEQMKTLRPELEKLKVNMDDLKIQIKEYKDFVDDLDKDGLLKKNEDYTIINKDGELTINGKKASTEVYNKYRSFLEKHKEFTIKKNDDTLNID